MWPKYYNAYLSAFQRMLDNRRAKGKLDASSRMGRTPEEVMQWWLESNILPGQYNLFEEET